MTVSAEEMEAVQLQPWEKNYCADLHVKVYSEINLQSLYLIGYCFYDDMITIFRPRSVITRMVPGAGGALISDTRLITV